MRAAAVRAAVAALCLACAAAAGWRDDEPPWSPAAAALAAASDAPAPFLILTRAGAGTQALADVCNRTRLQWRAAGAPSGPGGGPPSPARPTLACRLQLGGACRRIWASALTGFSGTFRPSQVAALHRCAPDLIASAELDAPVTHFAAAPAAAAPPSPPPPALRGPVRTPWNLDRLDQRATPLDGAFANAAWAAPPLLGSNASAALLPDGAGVSIYVIDSGLRGTHLEFTGSGGGGSGGSGGSRARVVPGYDFIASTLPAACRDCDGHGTHVAATAAGARTGVATGASLVCVRVLDCAGNGAVSDVVAALDWVAAHAARPAVATLSLGVPRGDWSASLEAAVSGLVRAAGVFVAVAAGNAAGDACNVSPAAVSDAFTVGATDLAPRFRADGASAFQAGPDSLYSWTDTGPCVDIFAPGTDILSACGGAGLCGNVSDAAYAIASGTSMAAPHVAGVAALLLSQQPSMAPADVAAALRAAATPGRLAGAAMLPGSPDLLLYAARSAASPPLVAASVGAPQADAARTAAGVAAAAATLAGAAATGAAAGAAPGAAFAAFSPVGGPSRVAS